MSRARDEWIGATDDTKIPDRVKDRVITLAEGRCAICTRMPTFFEIDHIVPLINGGKNRESNLQLLCLRPCHQIKTLADVKEKAVVYRKRKKDRGIKKPRTIRAWRRFDGSIVHAERDR